MNFEQEIRTLARRAIMEEINNLGIKALLREQIVDAGFTHDEIRAMIREAIDSFCRSALNTNDVAGFVRGAIENRVNQAADREITKIIREEGTMTARITTKEPDGAKLTPPDTKDAVSIDITKENYTVGDGDAKIALLVFGTTK